MLVPADPVQKRPHHPRIGEVFAGRYEILRQLSIDDATVTFLVNHKFLRKQVTLKLLTTIEPDQVKKFVRDFKECALSLSPSPDGIPLDFGVSPDHLVFAVFARKG